MAKRRSADEMGLKKREAGVDVDAEAEARNTTVQNIAAMFAQTLGQMGAIKLQSDEQVVQAVTAPRQVSTPEGAVYTSQTAAPPPPAAPAQGPEGILAAAAPEEEPDLAKDPNEVMMEQIAGVFAQAIQTLGMALMASNERVVMAITAPKQVTTPDGRVYTSETLQ